MTVEILVMVRIHFHQLRIAKGFESRHFHYHMREMVYMVSLKIQRFLSFTNF